MIKSEVEDVLKEQHVVEGEVEQSRTTTALKVKERASHYVQGPVVYRSDPRVKHFHHMSVADCAIYFLEKRSNRW